MFEISKVRLDNSFVKASKNRILKLLGISRDVYFYNSSKPTQDEQLRVQILSVLESNPSYGHRRIALALSINRKRVHRVMKLYGIKPYKRKGRWRKRRDERRPEAIYQNLIKGSFPIIPNHT